MLWCLKKSDSGTNKSRCHNQAKINVKSKTMTKIDCKIPSQMILILCDWASDSLTWYFQHIAVYFGHCFTFDIDFGLVVASRLVCSWIGLFRTSQSSITQDQYHLTWYFQHIAVYFGHCFTFDIDFGLVVASRLVCSWIGLFRTSKHFLIQHSTSWLHGLSQFLHLTCKLLDSN